MFFFNGQRETSGYVRVDGLSANLGLPVDAANVPFSAGATPARTANGAANVIASISSVHEAGFLAWQFRGDEALTPGRQVSLTTKSGSDRFRGSVFESFDGAALRANDWFANSRGLARPVANLHNFGGSFGGPIVWNRLSFFTGYEGLRGRNAAFSLSDVPSLTARRNANSVVRPLLDAFPWPNGPARSDGLAEFAAAYANRAKHNFADFRLDARPNSDLHFLGRYTYSGSSADTRAAQGFAPNVRQRLANHTQSLSGVGQVTLDSYTVLDLRANYSRARLGQGFGLDDFGGARTTPLTSQAGERRLSRYELLGRNAALAFGPERENLLTQFNLTGDALHVSGSHQWRWGADYRRLWLDLQPQTSETGLLLADVTMATATRAQAFSRVSRAQPRLNNFTAYTSYGWRQSQTTDITAGLLWQLGPPPRVDGQAAPLWRADYRNFAPRLGVAWSFPRYDYRTTLRVGLGWFYEMSNTGAAQVFGQSAPYFAGRVASGLPLTTLTPNLNGPADYQVLLAFAPRLRTPYSRQFALSLRHSLNNNIELTAGFYDTQGRRLWLTRTQSDFSPVFALSRVTDNRAVSSYRAFNLRFQTVRHKGFDTLLHYSFAQARDNYTPDTLANNYAVSADATQDYGPAEFDARHSFKGFISYLSPNEWNRAWLSTLLRGWQFGSLFNWRGATPVNLVYARLNGSGLAYLRPDARPGANAYLPDAGRLRRFNAAAFTLPTGEGNGNLPRNSLRGYGFAQVDASLSRKFALTQGTSLTLRAYVYNLLNRANFVAPSGFDASLGTILADGTFAPNTAFGQTRATAGQDTSAGANFLAPYQSGGARSMSLAVSFKF